MKKIKPFIPFIVVFLLSDILKAFSLLLYLESNIVFSYIIVLFFPILLFVWYIKKTGFKEFLLNKKRLLFLLVALVFAFTFDFIWDPIINIKNIDYNHELYCEFNNDYWKPELELLTIFQLLFYAPIVESILMIALLQKPLEKHVLPYFALVITAIIFSAVHFRDFPNSLFCFFSGMIYGFSFLKTRNLTIPILCHFLVNFISCCNFVSYKMDVEGIVLLIIFSICFIASFIYLLRYNEKPSSYSCEE